MKKVIIGLLMLGMALGAHAGNEGAQADPASHARVLAEFDQYGGLFVPPGAVSSYSYQIAMDGIVQVITRTNGQNTPSKKFIKQLSYSELSNMQTLVASVRPGALFDPNPSGPSCQDAGTSRYVVYARGSEIIIGENTGCKTLSRKNATAADAQIMKILADIANSDRHKLN